MKEAFDTLKEDDGLISISQLYEMMKEQQNFGSDPLMVEIL